MYRLYHCTDVLQDCHFFLPLPSPSQLHRLALALWMTVVRRSGRYLFLQIMWGMLLRVAGSFLWMVGGTWRWLTFIGRISASWWPPHLCHWPLASHPLSCCESARCSERCCGSAGYWVSCCKSACSSWSGSWSSRITIHRRWTYVAWAVGNQASSCWGRQRQRKDFFS